MHVRTYHLKQTEDRVLTSLVMALNSSFAVGLALVLIVGFGVFLAVRQP